ncbi:hypothetical protein DMENIID0001_120820 [Sergentomyia squamirostris]
MEGNVSYSGNRKSGIPKPTKFRNNFCTSPVENGNTSFLYGSVSHLPGAFNKSNSSSPSPTEEMSRSRWNLSGRSGDYLQKIVELERQNQKLSEDNIKFKAQIATVGSQLSETKNLLEKELTARKTSEAVQNEQKQIIKTLKMNVEKRDTEFQRLMEKNTKIRKKLSELLPEEHFFDDGDHSGISDTSKSSPEPSISDCMEKMADEIGKLKAYIGQLELQLYETDEKISDLMENKVQLERENATLKVENANMTTLAKLVTENMQESIDTSKKMEYTIRQMRAEKEMLKTSNRDMPDMVYPPPRKSVSMHHQTNIVQIRPEPERPLPVPPKRITEMHVEVTGDDGVGDDDVKKCDRAQELPEDVIERIRMLEIKLEIAERELTLALSRAEQAETTLEEMKKKESAPPPPPLPPPPPPPTLTMTNTPRVKIKSAHDGVIERNDSSDGGGRVVTKAPASSHNLAQSTGMDALVNELKNGAVTLRRRRPTDSGRNPALRELFDTLEMAQKQNRSSRTLMGSDFLNVAHRISEKF